MTDLDGHALVGSLLEREARLELLDELVVDLVGNSLRPLALRVEGEQLAGQLVRTRARAGLDRLPRLPAQLRERRRMAVCAHVAGDLGDLLVRDVEAVVAAERQEEVVARDACDGLRLEAEELPDAVILVHDEVAGAQVGEALERAADPDVGAWRALAEDLGVRQQGDAEVAQDEPAPRRRDDEDEARLLGEGFARLDHDGLDAPEQGLRAQRLAPVRERDDDPVAAAHECQQVALRLRQAAGGDRGSLGLEEVPLAGREL